MRIRAEQERAMLAALAWAGGVACAVLVLAGNAVSWATAFTAMDDKFTLDPNTRRLFEDAGFLLFVSGALAAILLVVAVSFAALRCLSASNQRSVTVVQSVAQTFLHETLLEALRMSAMMRFVAQA
jgi:hypothetical protein